MVRRQSWLFVVLIVAVLLRLPLLGGSLWLDEAAQALESARPLTQQLDIIPDFQPPLIHLTLHGVQLFSHSEAWMRFWLAVVPGVGSILFTMLIARQVFGQKTALGVGLLLATSSFHIFFSQELRPYALPTLFATCGWWLIIRFLTGTDRTKKAWWWFTLVSIAGWYSSFLYPFVWLSQVAWLFWRGGRQRRRLAQSIVTTGLAFAFWLPMFRLQLAAGGLVRTSLPGWSEVVSFTQLKSIPLVFGKFIFGVVDLGLVWWQVVGALILMLVLAAHFLIISRRWLRRSRTTLWAHLRPWGWLALWLVLPLFLAWVVSFWIPVIQPKRVLWLLPAGYLAVGWLVRQARTPRLGQALFGVLLVLNIIGLTSYWMLPSLQRENWRSAHSWVAERYTREHTLVVFGFDEPFAPWRWYDQGQYDTWAYGPGKLSVSQIPDVRIALDRVRYYRYVVTFDYLLDLSDPDRRLFAELSTYGFKEVDVIAYPNLGMVRVWARTEAVLSSL